MPGDAEKVRRFDLSNLEVFGGVFESEQALQEYMGSDPEKPGRLMEDLYLWGDFIGHVEYRFLPKKTSSAEEALADFPYEEKIISVLKAKFSDKFKKKVNAVIVLYDFHLMSHFSRHNLRQMKEKRTDSYHIFSVDNVFNYKD